MNEQFCSACGIRKRVAREDHPEKCPELPPDERPAEWQKRTFEGFAGARQ